MYDPIITGNVTPLKKRISYLEAEVARLKKLVQDIQRSPFTDDDFKDWYDVLDEYRTYGG